MAETHRAAAFDHAKLDKLYTIPSHSPSAQAPKRFPGVTPESTATLLETLRDNHVKWHIFFNEKHFHNHASHHLLALYHLGANGDNIKAAYATHTSYQRRAYESPGKITRDNFHEHLADEDYYNAYLKFFSDELLDKGAAAVIEEFIFSPKANIEPPKPGREPMQMANRFLAGLLHPLIHTGYGCEFGLLGQLAEGLAETAVHGPLAPAATPPTLMQYVGAAATDAANATASRLSSFFPSFVIGQVQRAVQPVPWKTSSKSVHALTLVARLMRDDHFSFKNIKLPPPVESEEDTSLERVLHLRGEELAEIAKEWTVDGTNAAEVAAKIEEIFWTNVVLFGIAGWGGRTKSRTGKFNADFFFLHLVNSSLFLPSIVAYLSPTSTAILLRTYLLNTLALYVARGSPALPVADFFDAVPVAPAPPADSLPHNKPADGTLTADNRTPSAWLAIAQSTLEHPDDHLCKLQRSLAHFDSLYGATPAGHFKKLGVELDGIERLDGSLFIRVAGLAQQRLGWMREGQEREEWDFDGFFHE
ncbi:uncharacterized protein TRAVEDRAFT_175105 [Trametes versicolor FP-101664 SS1]|uniref:uncharacterized protein n=1 Tax=Trametes versicolor (strain FP-101664) TaxID=717944 RepID=UPI000462147F|nr:uncharacterized protein TRAVEDRAFT_175105 [Trametes versicolor FP-101664 SS1]EIW52976.1 hypothetical protein TRAVEDRAFT_175105 [Trametes versicolor FP-101664 SS1]